MLPGITYRLRSGVNLVTRNEGCILSADFPLGAVTLNACWGPLFRWLSTHPDSDLRQIAHCLPGVAQEALGVFLHRLAIRGYLVEAGLPDGRWAPPVSVIIPVRNRGEDIKRCLSSLKRLRYPEECLEIIVVDDGSEDDTVDVAEGFQIKLLQNDRCRGASFSRNRGARHATGEIFCFIDSDCVADPEWLCHLMMGFSNAPVGVVGGQVDSFSHRSPLDRYEQVRSSLHMGNYARDSRAGGAFFYLPSCNLAVRREVFFGAGGFTETMAVGEDVDFCWRIIDAGGVIEYNPAAVIQHRHRNRIWPFAGRRFDYGTSEPFLQHTHRGRRKTMPIRPRAMIFWGLAASAALHSMLLIAAFIWLAVDAFLGQRTGRQRGINFKFSTVLKAKIRQNISVMYQFLAFGSRYYLLPALLLSPLVPFMSVFMAAVHVSVGVTDYFLKRPQMNIFSFLFYFTLEQLAYQAGVWIGCIRMCFFLPLAPKLVCCKAEPI